MAKKTTTKKTTTKANAKKAAAKKSPRTTAGTARAGGAAKPRRARLAKTTPQDHEVPSPKEVANNANLEEYAKSRAGTPPRSDKPASASAQAAAKRRKQDSGKDPVAKIAAKANRMSGLDLAAKVVADAGEPLSAKAIAERAIAAGWKTSGKTPHATLYAAMIREIAKKGKDARFVKTERGRFAASKGA